MHQSTSGHPIQVDAAPSRVIPTVTQPLLLVFALLLAALPQRIPAQQPTALPEAPSAVGTATISGIVLDIREALVPGAHVTLTDKAGTEERSTTSANDGSFLFSDVPAGNYEIRIAAAGLLTFISDIIPIRNEERYQLPHIALPVVAEFDVEVTVTEDQLAEEQVHLAIKQRTLGVIPNFYTSFIWNAAPLKARHKFHLATRSVIDPMTFVTTLAIAGEEQYRNKYPDYGDGAEGFAKRFGAAYGDVVIGRMIGGAILPSLFRQDPRYFYQGTGSITSRAWHAVSSAVICRGDNGRLQPNYSHVLGNFAAGGISNLYRPDDDRGVGLAINNALLHTAANAASNLLREFVLRGITTNVPGYAKGKPTQ